MGDAAVYDLAAVVAERDALKAEVEKLRDAVSWHRCSTHGDVDPTAWGCPECVRELRAEVAQADAEYQDAITLAQSNKDRLDVALAEVAKLKTENGRLTDVLLSKHGGEPLQLMDELDDARAEVAKLRAACAAKDAALSKALGYVDLDNDALISKCLAALKGTAGTNWIDATGAVEATVRLWSISPSCYGQGVNVAVPDDWAGAPVKIVRVKP